MISKFDNKIFKNKNRSIIRAFVFLFLLNISIYLKNDGV